MTLRRAGRAVAAAALTCLSSLGFWLLVAFVGAGVALTLSVSSHNDAVTARQNAAIARQIANGERIARLAADAAALKAKREACIAAIPQLRKIAAFVTAVKAFHAAAAANAHRLLLATPRTSPVYELRLKNYRTLDSTVPPVAAVHFHVPTVAECNAIGTVKPKRPRRNVRAAT